MAIPFGDFDEEAFELAPRFMKGRSRRTGRYVKGFRNLLIRQILEIPQAKHRRLALGQLGDSLPQALRQFRGDGGLFRPVAALGEMIVQGDKRFAAAQPVQRPASSHTAQVATPVPYGARLARAVGFEKNFLDNFFRIRRVAQDAPGRAEHERAVFSHKPIPIGHRGGPPVGAPVARYL